MHSKPLAPRPSGAAHPAASHGAAPAPAVPDPASPRGSSAGAGPDPGRRDRGALAVLVLSLVLVIVTPLPGLASAALGTLGTAGYLVDRGLWLVATLLTFALWAAVIWWLGRSRHGEGLGLAPLLALGVITLMSLIDPARATASLLVDVFTADQSTVTAVGALGVLSSIAMALAALVLAGLALLALLRRPALQRRVRVRLGPVTLAAVLVTLLAMLTVARPLVNLVLDAPALRSVLPLAPFHVPQIVSGLLSSAALVVLALVIARTQGRLRTLAWAVPVMLWAGVLATGAVYTLQTAMMIWSEQSPAMAGSLGPLLTVGVQLLGSAAATVIAVILLVLSVRARSRPDASAQA